MTDHGVMYGAVDFYSACKEEGIHPVIGCEVYICPDRFDKSYVSREYSHLILLCENQTGYQNLTKLVSQGFTEGFYYRPRLDYTLLRQHAEGLICLTACLSGDLPKLLLQGRRDDARAYVTDMQSIFGKDNFFIEVMDHGIPEERQVLLELVALARETGIPLVATNDCHYLERRDAAAQEVLMCVQTGKTLQDEARMRMETEELYVKSEEEMRAVFPTLPDAIDRAAEIAARCQVDFDFNTRHLPNYPIDNGETPLGMLTRLCMAGLRDFLPRRGGQPGERAPQAPSLRAGRDITDGFCRLFPDRVGFYRLRKAERHHGGPRARKRRGQHRGLFAAHHHARPAQVQPAVRALPEPRAHQHARYRRGLLLRAAAGGDRLRDPQIRRGSRGANHHLRHHEGQGRGARRGAACWA